MTVRELIDRLEEELERGTVTADSDVRLMTQARYPLEYHVAGACTAYDIAGNEEQECDDAEDDDISDRIERIERAAKEAPKVFYLAEGRQEGYGKSAAWEVAA